MTAAGALALGRLKTAYRPISAYGVIGDMHTAVLISADGCIDWGCLPHFDSPAMFLRLLDARKGGYCALAMQSPVGSSRPYLDGTNILETTREQLGNYPQGMTHVALIGSALRLAQQAT